MPFDIMMISCIISEVIPPIIASPANIADEGLKVRASDDAMLQSLSPIKGLKSFTFDIYKERFVL